MGTPTTVELVVFCVACDEIDERVLYARVGPDEYLCLDCWKARRKPWPGYWHLSAAELQEIENQTRKRMTERGGTDRHLVRKGLS